MQKRSTLRLLPRICIKRFPPVAELVSVPGVATWVLICSMVVCWALKRMSTRGVGKIMYAKEYATTNPTKRHMKNESALECSLRRNTSFTFGWSLDASSLTVLKMRGMQARTVRRIMTMLDSSLKTQMERKTPMAAYIAPMKRRSQGFFSARSGVVRDSRTMELQGSWCI